jgi:putative acetyltransferase
MGPGMEITYRVYEERDKVGVKALNSDVLDEYGFRTGPWDDDLDSVFETYFAGGCFWVAESFCGQIIGTAAVKRVSSEMAELKRLRVRKDFRRRGIGSRLLDLCISFCIREGYARLNLDTASAFREAICLYQDRGFELDGTRKVDIEQAISSPERAKWDGRLLLFHLDLI